MKKNVLIFYTDQQRFDSLGINGNCNAKTPNIDRLAKEGCNFTRHIAAGSVCMPSRASFLTGNYVPGHGVSSNGIPLWRRDNGCKDPNNRISNKLFGKSVPDKVPTMADYLREEGYQTALLGKLHVEPSLADKSYGFRSSYDSWKDPNAECNKNPYYGFEYVKNVLGHGEAPCQYDHGHYGRWLNKNHPEIIQKIKVEKSKGNQDGVHMSKVPSELHNSMWLSHEACRYIDLHKDNGKPMMIFIGFPDPHHDFTPPEDIAKEFENISIPEFAKLSKITGKKPQGALNFIQHNNQKKEKIELAYKYTQASIALIDRAIGKVIDKLKESNLYDDTIIIFTSDHGDMLGDFECLYKTDQPFYSLTHIPFILKPPSNIKLQKEFTKPMSNADVLPTVFSMLQINIPEYVQGINVLGSSILNRPMTTCYNLTGKNRNISIYDERYRYTYVTDTGEEELYDQISDPHEYRNLACMKEYRELCNKMKLEVLQKHLFCESQIYGHYGVW